MKSLFNVTGGAVLLSFLAIGGMSLLGGDGEVSAPKSASADSTPAIVKCEACPVANASEIAELRERIEALEAKQCECEKPALKMPTYSPTYPSQPEPKPAVKQPATTYQRSTNKTYYSSGRRIFNGGGLFGGRFRGSCGPGGCR